MAEEFDYFGNREVGKLFDLLLQLATEVHVTNQRLHALEALLVRKDVLTTGELDGFTPTSEEQQILDTQREELMGRLVRIITEAGPAEHPMRDQWEAALRRKAG
jgi:hypothetical protein